MDGTRVVVGYDGSAQAGLAVVVAAEVPGDEFSRSPDVDRAARRWAESVASDAVDVLVTASGDAALLVVGSRGHGSFTGALLGSVAYALTSRSSCPVVVVRGEGSLTPGAGHPVVWGSTAWRRPPSHSTLPPTRNGRRTPWPTRRPTGRGHAARGWLSGRKWSCVTPAQALVHKSHGAGLVVGARGRGRLSGVLLGSVSHATIPRGLVPRRRCPGRPGLAGCRSPRPCERPCGGGGDPDWARACWTTARLTPGPAGTSDPGAEPVDTGA